jgi:hypothetical protein
MAVFNKFNQFVQNMANGAYDLATDTIKCMLTNTAPVATNAVYADITEISAGNGYTTGGTACTGQSSTQSGGVEVFVATGPVFTASGGSIGPFRYVVLYDATPTSPSKPLIGWYDYGSAVTLLAGQTFTVGLDTVNGVFTVS